MIIKVNGKMEKNLVSWWWNFKGESQKPPRPDEEFLKWDFKNELKQRVSKENVPIQQI